MTRQNLAHTSVLCLSLIDLLGVCRYIAHVARGAYSVKGLPFFLIYLHPRSNYTQIMPTGENVNVDPFVYV